MSSSDSQDTPSTSSYTDSNTFSDPTSASPAPSPSEAMSSPQQFQPPEPFTPPPPFEPPAPFEVPSADAPAPAPEPAPAPGPDPVPVPDETYGQTIDPLTAEPVPQSFAAPDAPPPPMYTPTPLPAAYPPQPYGQPYNPYAATAAPRSQDNGMAIAGLVCSLVGLCSCVTVIVGVILGHIGLAKANRGEAGGRSMALAAVIIGYVVIALYVGFFGTLIILGVNGELD
ncbi:DUF4190 domain-containing protein [Amycolatopsis azurea]|uniref:DUF4190 domain-containing protein n=1 Tax=Amycolatopsis azurea DSM 43854 TaxID=1238180 RepID=M2QLA3_9PSEU|nr:DUF4190 domain-containing protein [Amycolatopsis azurea]EMD27456.1 hypothetical protein C791_2094 [Amycolatopsis azurea DSM 43854]OOC06448.1 hypothetical protein B0293_13270 [Amycolatopsis azurea DSM 43854]